MAGTVTGAPRILLRLEAVLIVIAAFATFARLGANWWLFAALFLAPDLSMLGYVAGRKIGAVVYNLGHWYGFPIACMGWGAFGHAPSGLAIGLIWAAHIGVDWTLGYGLKYADGFGVTHLGLVGRFH